MSTSLRRSGARTHTVLASAALALLLGVGLAGCSDDDPSDSATDPQETSSPTETTPESPTPTPTEEPSEASGQSITVTGNAGVTEAAMVSATDVGGSASTLAFLLDTEQARSDFASQFERGFGATVLDQARSHETVSGASISYGAVVAVGCDAPESVQIDAGEAGLQVTPQLPKKTVQCFAPMTFVVVFSAPGA